jgi:hypothetical protein
MGTANLARQRQDPALPPCLNLRDDLRIRAVFEEEREGMYGGKIDGFDTDIDSGF